MLIDVINDDTFPAAPFETGACDGIWQGTGQGHRRGGGRERKDGPGGDLLGDDSTSSVDALGVGGELRGAERCLREGGGRGTPLEPQVLQGGGAIFRVCRLYPWW